MIYINSIIIVLLLILSIQDIQNLEIDILLLILCLIGLAFLGQYKISALIAFLILNIIYKIKPHSIAYADILLITACSYNLEEELIGPFFLLIGTLGLIHCYIRNNKEIPFIPSIMTAFLIINFKREIFHYLPFNILIFS